MHHHDHINSPPEPSGWQPPALPGIWQHRQTLDFVCKQKAVRLHTLDKLKSKEWSGCLIVEPVSGDHELQRGHLLLTLGHLQDNIDDNRVPWALTFDRVPLADDGDNGQRLHWYCKQGNGEEFGELVVGDNYIPHLRLDASDPFFKIAFSRKQVWVLTWIIIVVTLMRMIFMTKKPTRLTILIAV